MALLHQASRIEIMKNKLLCLLLLLLTMRCLAATPIKSIRFASEATYPPFEYVNTQGQLRGFDIALAQALCDELNAECTFINQPWDSLIPGLNFKKFDAVISAMAITPARQKHVAFSDPYYTPSGSFVAHQDKTFPLTAAGLRNKTIAYQIGTTFGDYLNAKYPNTVHLKTYTSESSAILDLLAGRVDAIFGDTPVLQHWLQQGKPKPYQIVDRPLFDSKLFGGGYGIAVHRDNQALLQALNQALSRIKANGIYDRLVAHYFGGHQASTPQSWTHFIPLLLLGLKTTLTLAVIALLLGLVLGLIGAVLENTHRKRLRTVGIGLIHLIRGLPEILVLFFVYFGSTYLLNDVLNLGFSLSPFVAGALGLSLLFGAYASQVFRAAFAAIPPGQRESALALGLTERQCFFKILIPQAWRHALPGLGNLWFVLLKDTALVSLTGTHDLMIQAQVASANTLKPFTFYGLATVTYLALTSLSEGVLWKLRQRAALHLAVGGRS